MVAEVDDEVHDNIDDEVDDEGVLYVIVNTDFEIECV